jgi:tRNA U34 5-methylaminomethyl-2-thiouridine-forming methyltransferase MnmC
MNYSNGKYLDYKSIYDDIITSDWEQQFLVNDKFTIIKVQKYLQDFNGEESFDLIFFDAFSPKSQPELWTLSIFKQVYNLMNLGGVLVTYCAKGQVKRDLKSAGFIVESLEGPPGKREMLRARKLSVY